MQIEVVYFNISELCFRGKFCVPRLCSGRQLGMQGNSRQECSFPWAAATMW
jgi:hypothetical protein